MRMDSVYREVDPKLTAALKLPLTSKWKLAWNPKDPESSTVIVRSLEGRFMGGWTLRYIQRNALTGYFWGLDEELKNRQHGQQVVPTQENSLEVQNE